MSNNHLYLFVLIIIITIVIGLMTNMFDLCGNIDIHTPNAQLLFLNTLVSSLLQNVPEGDAKEAVDVFTQEWNDVS